MPRFFDRTAGEDPRHTEVLARTLRDAVLPLDDPRDLDPLLDQIGEARYVLLGEASHGTSEFYTWRARLSMRLILEKGFSCLAVEGDWPDCYRVNRYVRGYPDAGAGAEEVLHAFERWPTWMWANREIVAFARWLRHHNDALAAEWKVGFYGLDVYSLWASIHEVTTYLERVDPAAARVARRAYRCFDPYHEDEHAYARATALVPTSCEDEAVQILRAVRATAPTYQEDSRTDHFNAEQNALVARNAELYYRTMIRGGPASWNVRDQHMVETLERIVAFSGPMAKAIVWEHNTHVGDARFTDMARAGMTNVGQLVRQRHGEEGVVLVGFATHHGSVIAAEEWGLPMQRMPVPEARAGSFEDVFHRVQRPRFLIRFGDGRGGPLDDLDEPRGHRAIGVVYHPHTEAWGNYVPTILAKRYDALLFIDETHALDPLHMPVRVEGEFPETYPSGM
jgi:erythromycin esterase-like protein